MICNCTSIPDKRWEERIVIHNDQFNFFSPYKQRTQNSCHSTARKPGNHYVCEVASSGDCVWLTVDNSLLLTGANCQVRQLFYFFPDTQHGVGLTLTEPIAKVKACECYACPWLNSEPLCYNYQYCTVCFQIITTR